MIKRVSKATAEYATSETVVWWDMDTCPLPNAYDPSRLAPRIDTELKNLGYNGPLTIVAGGNLYGIPYEFLETLSSTGVVLSHTTSGLSVIVPSYLESRTSNSPLSIMLITTDSGLLDSIIGDIYMGVLVGYNLLLAYPPSYEPEDPHPSSLVSVGGEWLWNRESLLKDSGMEETRRIVHTTSCEMFSCASCPVSCYRTFENFVEHLEDEKHKTILEPNDDDEEMMIRVDAENLEALKQSERYINLLEAKKLEFVKLHKHFNEPSMMFKANNLEIGNEFGYVSPLLQMIKEIENKKNKSSEWLKSECEARKLKIEKRAGKTSMTKAKNLEIGNEEYVSPLFPMIKESQKEKNSEWWLKNEREARKLRIEKRAGKTSMTKANNLEIGNKEYVFPLLQMIKETHKKKKSEWLKNEREARKLKIEKRAGITSMTKANNLEIDNEESESPKESQKKKNSDWLKKNKLEAKELECERAHSYFSEPEKNLMTKANNLDIDNEESESPKESQKKKNSDWLKKNKLEAKELEFVRVPDYSSEPEKNLMTKANNLEMDYEDVTISIDQMIMELQRNSRMLKNRCDAVKMKLIRTRGKLSESPKESQKKNSEWLKKNKLEAKEPEFDRALDYFSEPEKSLTTEACLFEIESEESLSPKERHKKKNSARLMNERDARKLTSFRIRITDALKNAFTTKSNNLEFDNEDSKSARKLIKERQKKKNSEMLKNERDARKLKIIENWITPVLRRSFRTKANNSEINLSLPSEEEESIKGHTNVELK